MSIRVVLPAHLRTLARVEGEVQVQVTAPVSIGAVLDSLENQFPTLRGAMRDHNTKKRRDFVRFFACMEDLSHEPYEKELPSDVITGREPFLVVGAIAGG